MSESEVEVPVPAPPPPPTGQLQPPPPTKLRPSLPTTTREPRDEVRLLLGQLCHSLTKQGENPGDYVFVSHYRLVAPLIQQGPMCGLVAMCMATHQLGSPVTVENALKTARSRGYTIQGEMFSASQVGELARDLCGCQYKVTKGDSNYDIIIDKLTQGQLVLVPYDADRNNEPGLKHGHKAHWALLSGILQAYHIGQKPHNLSEDFEQDPLVSNLFHWSPSCKTSASEKTANFHKSTHDYVFAKQGKSAHTKLWSLKELMKSNRNLQQVGPQILIDGDNFIVPKEGINETLCDCIVLLYKSQEVVS